MTFMLVTYLIIKKIIDNVMILKEVNKKQLLILKKRSLFSSTLFIFNIKKVEYIFFVTLIFYNYKYKYYYEKYFLSKQKIPNHFRNHFRRFTIIASE